MAKRKKKRKKRIKVRNSFFSVMMRRYPRKQIMKNRNKKRSDNKKNHWMKDWE